MFQRTAAMVFLIALLCTLPIQAQLGIKGSLNLSDIHFSETPFGSDNEYLLGFTGGLVFAIHTNELFSLQCELLYSQKGQKYEIVESKDAFVKTRLEYLELPMLLQIYTPAFRTVKPYVLAGGYAAYLLSGKMSGQYQESTNVKDSFKKFDFGLIIDAGLKLVTRGKASIMLDFRYQIGLTDINDIAESTNKMRNRGFFFSAAFLF